VCVRITRPRKYSKASLTHKVNFVPCDRPIGHDQERPSNEEGGKDVGSKRGGSVVRVEGPEREMERKAEGVKRRGGG